MEEKIGKAVLAELIGTFVLVFSIIAAVTAYAGEFAAIGQEPLPNIVIPFVAFAHGFALFIMIQTLGKVSGGHFNPAVTLGLLSIRKIKPSAATAYIIAQVIGATLAGFVLAAVLNNQGEAVAFGSASLADGVSTGAGIVLEALMVFFLVWTITATAVNPEGTKDWAPLAIATALALGVLLIGKFTGAALNPARAFGPDFTNWIFGDGFGSVKDFFLVYLIAPIAGGILAATLYSGVYIKHQGGPDTPAEPPAPSEQSPT